MTLGSLRRRWPLFAAWTLLAGAISGCAAEPSKKPVLLGPVETGPGTLAAARQFLEGKWVLLSLDISPAGKPSIHAGATGTMVYDASSNMKVDLQLNALTAELAKEIGIPEQNGVVSTSGRTVIDLNNRSISYVLEGQDAFRPATHPLDTNRPRYYEIKGDTLTLRTKDNAGVVLSIAVWQKVKS